MEQASTWPLFVLWFLTGEGEGASCIADGTVQDSQLRRRQLAHRHCARQTPSRLAALWSLGSCSYSETDLAGVGSNPDTDYVPLILIMFHSNKQRLRSVQLLTPLGCREVPGLAHTLPGLLSYHCSQRLVCASLSKRRPRCRTVEI